MSGGYFGIVLRGTMYLGCFMDPWSEEEFAMYRQFEEVVNPAWDAIERLLAWNLLKRAVKQNKGGWTSLEFLGWLKPLQPVFDNLIAP